MKRSSLQKESKFMPKKFDEIDPCSNICGQGRSLPEWSDHLSLLNSRFLVLPPK